jgi:hypothetical protein
VYSKKTEKNLDDEHRILSVWFPQVKRKENTIGKKHTEASEKWL